MKLEEKFYPVDFDSKMEEFAAQDTEEINYLEP